MASLEFNRLAAGEIKRHPEVETLPVTKDARAEVMSKAYSGWHQGCTETVPLPRPPIC
jgi:hypothetical protein